MAEFQSSDLQTSKLRVWNLEVRLDKVKVEKRVSRLKKVQRIQKVDCRD